MKKPSLLTRIAVGKIVGFLGGGAAFFLLPSLLPEVDLLTRIGLWGWYVTIGAVVGLFGIMNYHPLLKFRMPFWFRGLFLGSWMNLLLVFLMYPQWAEWMKDFEIAGILFTNPYWMVLDGAILGLIADMLATWLGGEGLPEKEEDSTE